MGEGNKGTCCKDREAAKELRLMGQNVLAEGAVNPLPSSWSEA